MSTARVTTIAVLSGFCGLGSETLFLKILDESVGSAPLVAVAVVATFLVGMGTGAWLAPRVRRPWLVELALCAYDVAWLVLFTRLYDLDAAIISHLTQPLGPNASAALVGTVWLLPPALLLGVTLPVLVEHEHDVGRPYTASAVGALVAIVAVEALLYPRLGLRGCLAVMGIAHAAQASLLIGRTFRLARVALVRPPIRLVVTGLATGAFQGAWLVLANLIFRPVYWVQPVVVASMIAGLAIGSAVWVQRTTSFARVVALVAVGLLISSIGIVIVLRLPAHDALWPILVELPLLVLPAAIPIGALYPAFVRDATRADAGAALLALALGNAAGTLIASVVLIHYLPPLWSLVATAALLSLVGRRPLLVAIAVAIAALTPLASDLAFIRHQPSDEARATHVDWLTRGAGEVTAIYTTEPFPNGIVPRRIFQSGYSPITLGTGAESSIALTAGAYAHALDRALVLGAGSGRSAGTAASIFREVDVVDVGATVPALLRALPEENFGVLDRPNVTYHAFDAILAPEILAPGYDVIVLTVDPAHVAKAQKLYTVEYLARLKTLLRPGGVLVFWADLGIGAEGNQVLMNGGRAVFAQQKLFSVGRNKTALEYYLLVQSDDELAFHPDRVAAWRARFPSVVDRVYPSVEAEHLLVGRAHATTQLHSLDRPAATLLSGVQHWERIPLTR